MRGRLLVLAPVGNIEVNSLHLIGGGCSVRGWPSGHTLDAGEAIQFSKDCDFKYLIGSFFMIGTHTVYQSVFTLEMITGPASFKFEIRHNGALFATQHVDPEFVGVSQLP